MDYTKLTGLCVEDEPLVMLEMSKVLTEMGFGTVMTAHRLDTAFEHMGSGVIDLALLDYDLGHGERTTELGLALKKQGTCVVFASGYDRSDMDARLMAFPFIEKPATYRVLHERIAELIHEERP